MRDAISEMILAWHGMPEGPAGGLAGEYFLVAFLLQDIRDLLQQMLSVSLQPVASEISLGQVAHEQSCTLEILGNFDQQAKKVTDTSELGRAVLIKRARTIGATWNQIGKALSISPQGAYKRFSSQVDTLIYPGADASPLHSDDSPE